jgi:hypothetical protein
LKREVEEALRRAGEFRRRLLTTLSPDQRLSLLEALFVDFFVEQWRVLLKWAALTGQSAQVDTGYIAQHVASLVLAEPGQGFKGKGVDLLDGTEVKSAAILSGVDRPRWNHNLGTLAQDRARAARTPPQPPTWSEYLDVPTAFYLLFDRVVSQPPDANTLVLRVRAWCVDAQADAAWRELLTRFVDQRSEGQYNLQLHPPVGYDDDLVVNTLGNLDFVDVKVLEARIHGLADEQEFRVDWMLRPPARVRPMEGRCHALAYRRDPSRASRLSRATDVLPDLGVLAELLPELGRDKIVELGQALQEEASMSAADIEDPEDA